MISLTLETLNNKNIYIFFGGGAQSEMFSWILSSGLHY